MALCVIAVIGIAGRAAADPRTFGFAPQRGAQPATNAADVSDVVPAVVVLGQTSSRAPVTAERNDEAEIRIIQALEKPIDLELEKEQIRPVIQKLAQAAGIPIEIEPGTLDLLPYGSLTVIESLTIKQKPLGEVLTQLLRQIGLIFEPQGRRVAIVPSPALRRIVRRATWEEIDLLRRLYAEPWSSELFYSLKFQFHDARAGDFEANREQLRRRTETVKQGCAADVLDHACDQNGWCWYPSGPFVAVVSKTRQIERQLEKRVSVQYVQTSLGEALLDLASRAGVRLEMEPGVLANLPPQTTERFSLAVENATVRQALEVVAGQTGLSYAVEPDGLRLTAAQGPPPTTQGADGAAAALRDYRSNPIVGEIAVPNPGGLAFRFFVRESDLPPEVNDMRKARIRDAVNEMRRVLSAQQPQD